MSELLNESDDESPVTFAQFNQDFTSLCLGTKSGCLIINTFNDNIVKNFSLDVGPIMSISRLFLSSLITYVTKSDSRLLIVYHSKRNTKICDYRYSSRILSIKMNRDRLIVCVLNTIYIHNIRDMHLLHRINETPPNYKGIIALSSSENCLLAFPGSSASGMVYIFNALDLKNQISIAAHDGMIAALEFNSTATLLATASCKGTVIRVFNVMQGTKFAEFRRGLVRNVQISSLSFSHDDQYLVSTSDTETIHIFKLEKAIDEVIRQTGKVGGGRVRTISSCSTSSVNDLADELASANIDTNQSQSPMASTAASWSTGILSAFGSFLMSGASYLPYQVSEVFQKDRAFATCRIVANDSLSNPIDPNTPAIEGQQPNGTATRKVAAIINYQNKPNLLTVGSDGLLHIFEIDPINGGEGVHLRTINLLSPNLKSSTGNPNVGVAGVLGSNSQIGNTNTQSQGLIKNTKNFQSPIATTNSPPKTSPIGLQRNQISFAEVASKNDLDSSDKLSTDLINREVCQAFSKSERGPVNLEDVEQFPPIN